MCSLYLEQLEGNIYFLHEHPLHATSWSLTCMERLCAIPSVQGMHGDQCQFAAEVFSGPAAGRPVKKPSGFMSNFPGVAAALKWQCAGIRGWCSRPRGGKHELCSGKIASNA